MRPPVTVFCLAVLLLSSGCLSFGVETLLSTGISICAPQTLNKIGTYYTEVAIIEGHTPRTEITGLLGQPDAMQLTGPHPFMRYDFRKRPADLKVRLHVARRNGSELEVLLGAAAKLHVLTIYFDNRGIVRDIGVN